MPRPRTAPRPGAAAPPAVRLEVLSPQSPAALLEGVRALRLLPGQERFALAPATAVDPALVDPDRTPFAVLGAGPATAPVATRGGAREAGPVLGPGVLGSGVLGSGVLGSGVLGSGVLGFGVLGRGGVLDALVDDPGRAVLLRGFVVDADHQGAGVGTAAARAARALAARVAPSAEVLVLTCHDDNPAGLRAYARAGFVATGATYRDAGEGVQQVLVATVARG